MKCNEVLEGYAEKTCFSSCAHVELKGYMILCAEMKVERRTKVLPWLATGLQRI